MFIKVCGLTREGDALEAAEAGATALGFVFWPQSPRYVAPAIAKAIVASLPRGISTVGVFVNETMDGIRAVVEETGVGMVQLHGDEQPHEAAVLRYPLLKACHADEADVAVDVWPSAVLLLVDARDPVRRGGTGRQVDWSLAAAVARRRRVVLAGGLTPANVSEAIRIVRPYGVDVSTGVEQAPGVKDAVKLAQFVARARAAFADESPRVHVEGGLKS